MGKSQKSIAFVRFKRFVLLWARIAARKTIAPIFDQTAVLQLLAFPFFLYLVFLAQGYSAVSGEVVNSWAAWQALLYAVPLFILWNMISAVFSVGREERKQGQWIGGRFLYHSPKHIKTFQINQSDNGKNVRFKVKGAPANCFCSFKIEYEQGLGALELKLHENSQPFSSLVENAKNFNQNSQPSVRLNNKSEVVAEMAIPENSVSTIAKVSVNYWEI